VVVTFLSWDLLALPLSNSLTLLFRFVFSLLLGNLVTSMDRLLYAMLPGNLHNLLVLDSVALLLRDIFGNTPSYTQCYSSAWRLLQLSLGTWLQLCLGSSKHLSRCSSLHFWQTINITTFLVSDSLAPLLISSVALLPRFITALLAAENRSKTETGGIQPDSLGIRHDSVRNVDGRHKG